MDSDIVMKESWPKMLLGLLFPPPPKRNLRPWKKQIDHNKLAKIYDTWKNHLANYTSKCMLRSNGLNIFSSVVLSFSKQNMYYPWNFLKYKKSTRWALARLLGWLEHRPNTPRLWFRSPVRAHTNSSQCMHR